MIGLCLNASKKHHVGATTQRREECREALNRKHSTGLLRSDLETFDRMNLFDAAAVYYVAFTELLTIRRRKCSRLNGHCPGLLPLVAENKEYGGKLEVHTLAITCS